MLLSINPEHVENILSGMKKYEFRKVRCRSDVDKMIIYSTAPVMAVVGEAEIINVIEDEPEKVWRITADYSGISKEFFDKYYRLKDKAVAYKLGKIKKYIEPFKLSDFGINFAPQSFVYLK
jgi:predicted transcriptional regulator